MAFSQMDFYYSLMKHIYIYMHIHRCIWTQNIPLGTGPYHNGHLSTFLVHSVSATFTHLLVSWKIIDMLQAFVGLCLQLIQYHLHLFIILRKQGIFETHYIRWHKKRGKYIERAGQGGRWGEGGKERWWWEGVRGGLRGERTYNINEEFGAVETNTAKNLDGFG